MAIRSHRHPFPSCGLAQAILPGSYLRALNRRHKIVSNENQARQMLKFSTVRGPHATATAAEMKLNARRRYSIGRRRSSAIAVSLRNF